MLLVWLLKNVVYRLICGDVNTPVRDIIYDSRNDVSGCVFVCLKGCISDGHDYADAVIEKKAGAVVIETGLSPEKIRALGDLARERRVCLIAVENTRAALSEMSRAYFGYPERKLTMIGITGTKGKTTAAGLLGSVLSKARIPAGIMGTTGVFTGKRSFETVNTTPESYLVQKYLRMMVDDGCKAAIMEVSSQALMCCRVRGIFFDYGILTNISPDHIGPGEHGSLEEYIYWKGQLFSQCHTGIVNGADSNVKRALSNCGCRLETFGVEGDSCILDSGKNPWIPDEKGQDCPGFDWLAGELLPAFEPKPGTLFAAKRCATPWETQSIFLGMPGKYNIYNALPAIAVARHMGISWERIAGGLNYASVCGRCEVLARVRGGYFILDYAHNGKSLEVILETLRQYNPKRLICIFGCGGNRSKLRRTDMARAAVCGADHLIITSDNPRYEALEEIIHDIEAEILRISGNPEENTVEVSYEIIEDRRLAIRRGLEMMEEGDMVLLAGKGHETYQEIKGKKYPFDEHKIVSEEIALLFGPIS